MADTTVHIGENSPEQVAFKLMQAIANAEGVTFNSNSSGKVATREWIIRTYQQCLATARLLSPIDDLLALGRNVQ